MSVGVPELVILLIVAAGIGVTTLVVVVIAVVVLRQRGGRFDRSDPDTEQSAPPEPDQ